MASMRRKFEGRRPPLSACSRRFSLDFRPFHKIQGRTPVRLKDKIAVITGGGRGIGRDIALGFAQEGAHVVINDIDPDTAAATAKEAAALGSNSLAVPADVARAGDIHRLIDTTVKERGRVDILVNNAMKVVPGRLEELPEAAWDTTMNIGLKGAFLTSQAAARHMMAQKSGVIVNIASIAGLFPYNFVGAYSVVKAGLIMLTKLQALEWAPYGIRANAITPGYIRTPGTEAMYADPAIMEGRIKTVPMGRVGSGEDIVGPAIFLASEEARYTTGSVLGADGGQAVGYFLAVPGRRFSGGSIE
jgi:3-oxoacyl-[acyl-carrier protein] reductase